jgi:hypothetical protein
MDVDLDVPAKEEADLANAVDLSESEEEEELEDIVDDFAFDAAPEVRRPPLSSCTHSRAH